MKRSELKNHVLKLIVEEYISEPKPVGSVHLIVKYNLNVSSATIRNIMAELESEKLIQKSHTSSGRIPTTKGYEYYAKFLTSAATNDQTYSKIKDIFANRRSSIDKIIDEAVSIISEISKLTLITTDSKNQELLKSITLTPISEKSAIVVIITSGGKVESKELKLRDYLKMDDLKIAVRIFQERLYNISLSQIPEIIKMLEPILREKIKNYEQLIESFVTQIFTQYVNRSSNNVFGKSYIIKSNDIERNNLAKIIDMIENQSIWESINEQNYLEDNLKLEILPLNASLISKRLNINGHIKDISIIGAKRMDYSKAKNILNMIEKYVGDATTNDKPKLLKKE